jgi:hypothetical protein
MTIPKADEGGFVGWNWSNLIYELDFAPSRHRSVSSDETIAAAPVRDELRSDF